MEFAGVFTKSDAGSKAWIVEKFAKIIFVPTALYVFFYILLSYKITKMPFYIDLFFVNLLNISVLALLMVSGIAIAYLRFNAILLDYVKSHHKRIVLKTLFIAFNIFFFTFVFFTFIYFNFLISITTL